MERAGYYAAGGWGLGAGAMSLTETIEALGRSDYKGRYHDNAYGLQSQDKQAERDRGLDYLLGWYGADDCVKLLSLPGLDWTFERQLLAVRRYSQFVGLEHSYSAYMRSRRAIPGVDKARSWDQRTRKETGISQDQAALSDRSMTFGRGEFVYSRRSARVENSNRGVRANRLLYMKSDTYATMLTTDYGATMQERKAFSDKFYFRNAAWLDFTSQFCESVRTTLANLHFCMAVGRPKPVVVTMMNARDGVNGVDARISRIMACQPLFRYWDHWTYSGKNGTPMLTVCGSIE